VNSYDSWREDTIKEVGLDTQLKAEAMLDKQADEPFVELRDNETGAVNNYRRNIADVYEKRQTHSRKKFVMTVPELPWKKENGS
jgi:hypothetical protein